MPSAGRPLQKLRRLSSHTDPRDRAFHGSEIPKRIKRSGRTEVDLLVDERLELERLQVIRLVQQNCGEEGKNVEMQMIK